MSGDSPVTDEEIVAALAEEMARHERRYVWERKPWGDGHRLVGCICGWDGTTFDQHRVAALLPVVRRAAEQRAAEAVQLFLDLADELLVPVDFEVTHYRDGLRDSGRRIRAAALTATLNHGRNAT